MTVEAYEAFLRPHYADDHLTVWLGDVRACLAAMEPESVQSVITSPPYWGLRDYGIPPSVWGGRDDAEHSHRDHVWGDGLTRTAGGTYTGKARWQHDVNGRGEEQPGERRQRVGIVDGHPEANAGAWCGCGAWRGCLGLEPTPELFVEHIVEVFREVWRVLRKDGTVWLNLGDSYSAGGRGAYDVVSDNKGNGASRGLARPNPPGFKPKDRIMIPARVALALQADGWWLRDEIVWSKPNPMPSSVTDRTTPAHEMVYLLTRSARYHYDAAAIRERASGPDNENNRFGERIDVGHPGGQPDRRRNGARQKVPGGWDITQGEGGHGSVHRGGRTAATYRGDKQAAAAAAPEGSSATRTYAGFNERWDAAEAERRNPTWAERKAAGAHAGGHGGRDIEGSGTQRSVHGDGLSHTLGSIPGRNKRSVWTVATQPYPEAHFATFPEKLVEPMILAGTPPGGVVLDPFGGSGTVALVAERLQRRAVLIDLSEEYVAQALRRISGGRAAGTGAPADLPIPFASDGLWGAGS